MIGHVGTIHQVDRTLAIVDPRMFVTACEFELEAGRRFVGCLDFGALNRRIEIIVDRGAIHDAGYLVTLVVVEEDVAVERKCAVQQCVLSAQLIRIDKFRFEGQRMDGIGDPRAILPNVMSRAPGGLAPPAL